jgi:transposase
LRLRPHTGRPPTKANLALSVVAPLLEDPLNQGTPTSDEPWTCGRLADYIKQESGVVISAAHLSKVLRKKGGIGENALDTP